MIAFLTQYVYGLGHSNRTKLIAEETAKHVDVLIIEAVFIEGVYQSIEGKNQIVFLNVYDETIAYIKNNNTEMYAKNIKFDEKTSIILLEESVKIIRDGETITGDYGTLDTKNNSYKIKSNNSKKVRVVISNKDE